MDMDSPLMQQANNIWSMLDEMSDKDPQAYQKFIDKQLKDGLKSIQPPNPHMCIMTNIMNGQNFNEVIYINVCSWSKIPAPKTDDDPIPVTGGSIYDDIVDKNRRKLITVAFNEQVLIDFGIDAKLEEEKRMLINLAFEFIENQHGLKLSRDYTLLSKKTSHKGNLKLVESTLLERFQNTDNLIDLDLNNFQNDNTSTSLLTETPSSLLNLVNHSDSENSSESPQLLIRGSKNASTSDKKSNLIEEVETTYLELEHTFRVKTEPYQSYVYDIALPDEMSTMDCDIQICKVDFVINIGEKYKLHRHFQQEIDDANAIAKFSKLSRKVRLIFPVKGTK